MNSACFIIGREKIVRNFSDGHGTHVPHQLSPALKYITFTYRQVASKCSALYQHVVLYVSSLEAAPTHRVCDDERPESTLLLFSSADLQRHQILNAHHHDD